MYSLDKCREILKENNFEVNENDEVKTNTFYFDKKVEYWVSLREVVKKLNNGSYNLNHHEVIIYNLLFSNKEELQTDEQDVRKMIENNLKSIGFELATCIPCYDVCNCFQLFEIVLGNSSVGGDNTIYVNQESELADKFINLEEIDAEKFLCKRDKQTINLYNKLVRLHKMECEDDE